MTGIARPVDVFAKEQGELDRGEGAVDAVGGSVVFPMLFRDVAESERPIGVLDQALGGVVALGGVSADGEVEGLRHLDSDRAPLTGNADLLGWLL